MRPWARAHGNTSDGRGSSCYPERFNEAVGSCPRKPISGIRIFSPISRFNEAVGSCPRKRRKGGHPKGFVFDASMRPWARAHGNASQSEPHHHAGIASMRPWARAHGNMVRARPA